MRSYHELDIFMVMKITLKELKSLIREEVVKATKDGPFGAYLFGQQRGLPTKKSPEKNTDKEIDFAADLYNHYMGEQEQLDKWLNIMISLNNQGKYKDILRVPSAYKYAYRMVSNINHDTLMSWLGYDPDQMEPGEIYEEDTGGTYTPKEGLKHSSWSVDPDAFQAMLNDWGRFTHKPTGYLVFLRAPIRGNTFLLNPDETRFAAEQYSYQREVISVGPVEFDHIWYVPLQSKKKREDSWQAKERLGDIDLKASQHVADYERSRRKR